MRLAVLTRPLRRLRRGRVADTDGPADATESRGTGDPEPGRGTGRRTLRLAFAAGLIVAMLTGIATMTGGDRGSSGTASATMATATVERRDLVVTDGYDGSLGFGEPRSLVTERDGVVTEVEGAGTTVGAGEALFSVDFEPTVVLTGSVPAYRDLSTSSDDGPDIEQLERGLAELGYGDSLTVDEDFTSSTAAAVEEWEEALGRSDPDGVVELGDVVFLDGGARVAAVNADVGTRVQSGATVVEGTPTTQVVTFDLEADRSSEVEPGMQVAITMPDGTETTGTITEIGTEAESSEDTGGGPGGGGGSTVPVTVTLDDPDAALGFDTGSVDVAIERSRDDGATAVPVTALLALAEGGYAVQIVDAGQANGYRLARVEVGTYADGWVGVTGDGVEPGVEVVVPE